MTRSPRDPRTSRTAGATSSGSADAEPQRSVVSRIAVPFSVFALVASAATVGWLWRHPDVFEPAPDLAWGYADEPVGKVHYFAVTTPAEASGEHRVTVDEIEASVLTNTSEARIEFFVCELDPSSPTGPVGAVDDVNGPCARVTRLEAGSSFETGAQPAQQVVMAVQPQRPGRVEVAGVSLAYAKGWQHGTAWFGNRVVIESVRHRGDRSGDGPGDRG